jgi:hypothetical protein
LLYADVGLRKSISQEVEVQRSVDLLKSITNDSQATLLQKTSLEGSAESENDKLRKGNGERQSEPSSLYQLEKEALSL